ncbi:WD40/YVTN/BNR-like repeat-containing protein [Arcticibacter sp. MXS-1]|uniref:WD40/YVTN/BNR-like repeat-containing protein n=1 Tax=Arcticibacter sp. MXS-1 TaxID=3341726 RepID=UPI0035A84C9F
MKTYFFLWLFFLPIILFSQTLQKLHSQGEASIRGMSVADASVVWLSGSKGWFARSTDGGRTWDWKQVANYAELDFRGIAAFSEKKAVIMNSGSPAVILFTEDGGQSWTEVYRNEAKEIFLDGISFFNAQEGLVYGDPVNGQMQLLKTRDGGRTWMNISARSGIHLQEGEASFAASNTGICTLPDGHVWIVTGGVRSRVFCSADKGRHWSVYDAPILQGMDSRGPFSIDFYNAGEGIMVGGDYKTDTLRDRNAFLTTDGGKTWHRPDVNPFGFRSCVTYVAKELLLSTGTSGTDISKDGGKTWTRISDEGYHVASVLKKGKEVLLAGAKGRIALVCFD